MRAPGARARRVANARDRRCKRVNPGPAWLARKMEERVVGVIQAPGRMRIMRADLDMFESGPVPSWWSPTHERVWAHLAPDLERLTLRQLAHGTKPPIELDVADAHDAGAINVPWLMACAAVRLGHAGASYYVDERVWSDELELELARDWTVMRTGMPWSRIRTFARLGWERGSRARLG